jgi:hypothetical protein
LDRAADDRKEQKQIVYPRRVVLTTALLVLLSGMANLVRGAVTLQYRVRLPPLPMTAGWGYLLAVAIFWGVVLTSCGASMMCRLPWSRRAVLVSITTYQAHNCLNRFVFDASDYALGMRGRDLLLTTLVLGFVWGGLSLPSVKELFRE